MILEVITEFDEEENDEQVFAIYPARYRGALGAFVNS
jgi:hypothetical protein